MKSNKNLKFVLPVIACVVLFAAGWFLIRSGSGRQDNTAVKDSSLAPSRVQVIDGITNVVLRPSELAESGITTVKLSQIEHQSQLAVFGTVVSIKNLANDVQGFETAKAQLAKSKESLLISQKNYERLKNLYEKKLASEQDFQAAQAAFLSDQADVNASSSSLRSQRGSIIEQWGNGISKWIFNDSPSLQDLLDIKEELIQISLPQEELNTKTPGNILIQSPSSDKQRIPCRFVSTGHLANSQFQTKTLYYITFNSSLSGGMNIKAFLPVGENLTGVIVPASSIVWYQGKAWFYAEKFPNKFIRVEIDTDNPVNDGFFIHQNKDIINPGVTVVKNGAQLLLSAELTPAQISQSGEGDND